MPPYRAQSHNIFGNVGGPQQPREGPDIGGAIQQLGLTATSLIHGQYLRQMARQQREHQYGREAIEDKRYEQERADKDLERQEKNDLERKKLEYQALEHGITPGKEGGATVKVADEPPATAPTAMGTGSSIKDVLTRKFNERAQPQTSLAAPVTPGSLGSMPKLEYGTEDPTPTTYDPSKALTVEGAQVRADASTANARLRSETALKIRSAMSASNIDVAKIRAGGTVRAAQIRADAKGAGTGGTSPIHTKLSAAQLEKRFETQDAPAILAASGNSLADATDMLNNSPEGQALKAEGFTERHLAAALIRQGEKDTDRALKLQGGAFPTSPDSAAAKVAATKAKTLGVTKAPAAGAQIKSTEITDDELKAAVATGAKTAADVRAAVAKARAAKPKAK